MTCACKAANAAAQPRVKPIAEPLVPSWLGVLLLVAGLLSLVVGISVGYAGLESGFQDAVTIAFQLVVLVFIVGLLVVGPRRGDRAAAAPG